MDHDHETGTLLRPPTHLDYSLTGSNAKRAIELGLAEADWYQSPVPQATMRTLHAGRDAPAIRDTIIWLRLILGFGSLTYLLWAVGGPSSLPSVTPLFTRPSP